MELSDKRILVIGGAGLIGSHTVEALLTRDVSEVVVFDDFSRGTRENLAVALADPRVRVFDDGGNLQHRELLRKAMEGSDGVIHLAALWLLQCLEYPDAAFDVNVRGTFDVAQCCIDAGVERLVWASSASVYGDALETPMTEDHPYNNETFYGATKIAGEQLLKALGKRYGLSWAGMRYMNVYGPRQDYKTAYTSVIHKVLDRIEAGEPPVVFGDGSQCYDFISVRDVARANVLALEADTPGECYNVGRGIGTTIKELAELLVSLAGSDQAIRYEPAGQTFVTHRIGCPEKAKRDLGFEWTIDLEEGLREVIAWRREEAARDSANTMSEKARTSG
ncbi:MAG: NAD-dependent epimerase/dehydratase family protein [Myxococcota bacterium]|nr:NAD-dependent epimerase/dehydratase family protein [Myxococcota bacterium]